MDPKSTLCTALMRLGTRMATVFDQHMAPLGLSQAQFRMLLEVYTQPSIAPSALAEHLMLDKATISLVSAKLVKAGWLERREGVNRRTHELVVTESGRQLLDVAVPKAVALADATLPAWSEKDLATFLKMLHRLEQEIR